MTLLEEIQFTLFTRFNGHDSTGIEMILGGLQTTIVITFFSLIVGCFISVVATLLRETKITIFTILVKLYIDIIRGTPVLIQLLIIYFVIFASVNVNRDIVAVIAFGINSGAYLTEIIRSGIKGVDVGQYEAAKSLGMGYFVSMKEIIMPQAIKIIIPSIGNEFISLLKETSIIGYIGTRDITKAGSIVSSITYSALVPLVTVALIYLVLTLVLSKLISLLESKLNQ